MNESTESSNTTICITPTHFGEPPTPTPGLLSHETTDPRFQLISYDKKRLTPATRSMRSVVMMGDEVVSFSPPKSVKFEQFMTDHADTPDGEFRVEEIVEGVMVNCFCVDGQWYLATKSQFLGAANHAIDTNSNAPDYRYMFMDAARGSNLDIRTLREDWSYSFILRHPRAQVVNPVIRPQLILCRAYDIDVTDHMITERCAKDVVLLNEFHRTNVTMPRSYRPTEMDEPTILAHHQSMTTSTYVSPGIMIMAPTGERTKHRNPAYEMVRHTCAAAKQTVAEIVGGARTIGDTPVATDLYRMYVERYIHKTTTPPTITTNPKSRPRRERTIGFHLAQLQNLYFAELKPDNRKMSLERVVEYISTMDGKTQINVLDAVAWISARNADRAKRAAERAAEHATALSTPSEDHGTETTHESDV